VLLVLLVKRLKYKMAPLPSVVILPAQVAVVAGIIAIPSGLQTSAKLLKLKSMARQNRKYWDRLKTFLTREFPYQ
jgi:hypothetical protein